MKNLLLELHTARQNKTGLFERSGIWSYIKILIQIVTELRPLAAKQK
jgi:hypothetical protein